MSETEKKPTRYDSDSEPHATAYELAKNVMKLCGLAQTKEVAKSMGYNSVWEIPTERLDDYVKELNVMVDDWKNSLLPTDAVEPKPSRCPKPDTFIEEVKQARRVWLDEYDPKDGTDVVTPFDQFLYQDAAIPPSVVVKPTPVMTSKQGLLLANEIGKLAVAAGIIKDGTPLTGPQLVMLAQDIEMVLLKGRRASLDMQLLDDLLGAIQDGSDAVVTIFQDDATKMYNVRAHCDMGAHTTHYGHTLHEALNKHKSGE